VPARIRNRERSGPRPTRPRSVRTGAHTHARRRPRRSLCGSAHGCARFLFDEKVDLPYTKKRMSFVLADFIYGNLEALSKAYLLTRIASCGPSAEEYVGYRLGFPARSQLREIIEAISQVPGGDQFLRSEDQLRSLAETLEDNPEDGMYWVVIDDEYPPGISGHVMIIEVEGDQACLIQTYNIIGSRDVCGRRLCRIPKVKLAERLEDIAQLLTSDQEVIEWSLDDWYEWLELLGLPPVPPPFLPMTIKHRRTQWGFVPLGSRGVLHGLYKRVTDGLAYGRSLSDHQRRLLAIRNQIEQLSMGTDYLASVDEGPM